MVAVLFLWGAQAEAQSIAFGAPIAVDDPVFEPGIGPHPAGVESVSGGLLVWGTEGIRLAVDGSPLDPLPFPVGGAQIEVACSDTQCVILRDERTALSAQRMTTDGTLVDPDPRPFAADGSFPIGAWRGSRWIVVWQDFATEEARWAHVAPDGSLLDATPHSHASPTGDRNIPRSIACGSTECLLVFQTVDHAGGPTTVRAIRVDESGADLDPTEIAVHDTWNGLAEVAHQGDWYLVLMGTSTTTAGGVRVTPSGTVLDDTPIALGSRDGTTGAGCTSSGCVVAGLSSSQVEARFVRSDGTVEGPHRVHTIRAGERPWAPYAGCRSAGCLVVWDDRDSHVLSARAVGTDGVPGAADVVHPVRRANRQLAGPVVAGDARFLATWWDIREGVSTLRASRIEGGASLDPVGLVLAESSGAVVDAAFGAGLFAVVHQGASDSFVVRVGTDGRLLDTVGTSLATAAHPIQNAAIDFDGESFLVVGDALGSIIGRRVSPSGATLEPGFTVIETADAARRPALAFDGTSYLVVWEERRGSRGVEIYGRRVAADGSTLDALSIPIGGGDGTQQGASVAFGTDRFLVVWQDGFDDSVRAARVMADGSVMDPLGVVVRASDGTTAFGPDVAWDGTSFIVTWSEVEPVEDPPGSGSFAPRPFVAATRVDLDGAVEPPARFPVRQSSAAGRVASGAGGTAVLFTDDDSALANDRALLVVLEEGSPPGTACAGGGDCASGFCSSGVCCDRACEGDCESCAAAEGAERDGTCSPRPTGAVCRPATAGSCDLEEVCDGTTTTCPPDTPVPGCVETDAGADGGGAVSDAGTGPTPEGDGCSCHAGRRPTPPPSWLTLALLGAALSLLRPR